MKYQKLVDFYMQVSSTTKRLEKIKILSEFLKKIPVEEKDVVYLLLGDIYPEYDERRIGISNQLAIKSIAKSVGVEESYVNKEWKEIGDLGLVSKKLKEKKSQATLSRRDLTTEKVLDNLRKLPVLEGKGTVGKKISLIVELLVSASASESLYLVRTLIGDLRIGLKESTIKEAIASAFFNDEKESAKKIQDAIARPTAVVKVYEMEKGGNRNKIEKVSLETGKPIKVMLAQKAKTIE